MRGSVMASKAAAAYGVDWARDYDLWLELFVIFNLFCLTGDVALAHASNRFRNPAEYFPLFYSAVAAIALGVAFAARIFFGMRKVWRYLGFAIAWGSIAVGVAGVIYHLDSHFFVERTLKSLTYTAPFAAPLAFVGLGCLLLMNRMVPHESEEWEKWVLFFAFGGFVGNFVLSLADHATNGFFRWSEWLPVISSSLAIGFLFLMIVSRVGSGYRQICLAVLVVEVAVGVAGFGLHLSADIHGPAGRLIDNVLSGAPPFAPLLLPNLAILGWIGLRAHGYR